MHTLPIINIIIIIIDVYSKSSSFYGYGNGTIWLDYMYCNGAESKLIDCNHAYGIGFTTCGYNEMAGVYCQCMYINMYNFKLVIMCDAYSYLPVYLF